MKKALFWGYRFADMKISWVKQVQWIAQALQEAGYTVLKHPKFICDIKGALIYDFKRDTKLDIVIYNHTDVSRLIGDIVASKRNWFFKPTVPDEVHTTLDELGYGPYSSITYKKPPFEQCNMNEVNCFFKTKVKDWINNKNSKWGTRHKTEDIEIKENNYYLVLGQCGGDAVVTRHDFGNYFQKLKSIVKELDRVGDKHIIVKLHPYTDGKDAKNNDFSIKLGTEIANISKKVTVYIGKSNLHKFIEKANCVILANSGAGFEVQMHHKPIIAWGFPEYNHIAYDLRHLCDMKKALNLDWFEREKSDKFLYWYLEKYCYFNQASANQRVKELLNEK